MDLTISELRLILKIFDLEFDDFLSDSEQSDFFNIDDSSRVLVLADGVEVTSFKVSKQQFYYGMLNLYIKLLQELYKNRPLPF